MSVEGMNRKSASIPPVTVERTRQEIWNQLGYMGCKIQAIPTATDAITKVKESVRMRTGLHVHQSTAAT